MLSGGTADTRASGLAAKRTLGEGERNNFCFPQEAVGAGASTLKEYGCAQPTAIRKDRACETCVKQTGRARTSKEARIGPFVGSKTMQKLLVWHSAQKLDPKTREHIPFAPFFFTFFFSPRYKNVFSCKSRRGEVGEHQLGPFVKCLDCEPFVAKLANDRLNSKLGKVRGDVDRQSCVNTGNEGHKNLCSETRCLSLEGGKVLSFRKILGGECVCEGMCGDAQYGFLDGLLPLSSNVDLSRNTSQQEKKQIKAQRDPHCAKRKKKMLRLQSVYVTLLYLAWVYCFLIPYEIDAVSSVSKWITSVAFWVAAVGGTYRLFYHLWHVLTQNDSPWQQILDFSAVYVCVVHCFAALGMTLVILGGSDWIVGSNLSASAYSIFVGDFLLVVVNVYSRSGWVNIAPRPSTVLGSLWGIFVSITGLMTLSVLFALIMRGIKKVAPLSDDVVAQCREMHSRIIPVFQADYGGLREVDSEDVLLPPVVNILGRRRAKKRQ